MLSTKNIFFLKRIYNFSGYLVLFLLFLFNFLSLNNPFFGRLGVFLWIFSFFYFFIFLIKSWYTISKNRYFPIYTISLLVLFLFFVSKTIPSMIALGGESVKVISCTLENLKHESDFGYNKTCLYGYPSRQYLIPTLPSLLFGQSLINLNIGGSIYLILALFLFSSKSLQFFKFSKKGDLITALILGIFLHFHFFNYFAFVFEQSIFPLSFGLIAASLILDYLIKKDISTAYLFGFCLFYLIYSYTPSLALIPLFLSIIFYFLIESFKQKDSSRIIIWSSIIFISLTSLLVSVFYRSDINIFSSDRSLSLLWNDLAEGLIHIFVTPNGDPYMTTFIFPFFILLILFPIFYSPNFLSFAIFIWSLLALTFSIISKGYEYYPIFFRVHRSIIILPVLLTYLIYKIKEKKLKINRLFLKLFLVLIIIFGSINFYSEITDKYQDEMYIYSVIQNIAKTNKKSEKLIILGKENDSYMLYPIFTKYFLPESNFEFYNTNESCSSLSGNLFLISGNNYCFQFYKRTVFENFKWIEIRHSKEETDVGYLFYSNN